MKTIWKFKLEPDATLSMPKDAQILSVHEQGDEICLWALVDSSAVSEPRRFVTFGTGFTIPDQPMIFIGSSFLYGGTLVMHTFEIK